MGSSFRVKTGGVRRYKARTTDGHDACKKSAISEGTCPFLSSFTKTTGWTPPGAVTALETCLRYPVEIHASCPLLQASSAEVLPPLHSLKITLIN